MAAVVPTGGAGRDARDAQRTAAACRSMPGAIKVYSTRPRDYTTASEDILRRFVAQAAILLANMHTWPRPSESANGSPSPCAPAR